MGQSPNFNKRQRSSESRRCTTTTDSNMQEAKVAVEPSRVHVDGNARRPAGRGGPSVSWGLRAPLTAGPSPNRRRSGYSIDSQLLPRSLL